MSQPEMIGSPVVESSELRAVLESVLSKHFGARRRITDFERRPSPYRTSFALENIALALDDGTALRLVFKNLGRTALHHEAFEAKPDDLYDPLREIETYRTILGPGNINAPAYYGAAINRRRDQYWLFMEHVPGWTLFEVERDDWPAAAQWLAGMHGRFVGDPGLPDYAERAHLLRYDAAFLRRWSVRAYAFAHYERMERPEEARRALQRIVGRYDSVVERLLSLPQTFLHGEFFASNVLMEPRPHGHRVCPIDWEMAAIGPALIDLAALVSGNWSEEERERLALVYYQALPPGTWSRDFSDFLLSLGYCRLHVAMQWVGWSQLWSPPSEHAQDWLGEVLRLAEVLQL